MLADTVLGLTWLTALLIPEYAVAGPIATGKAEAAVEPRGQQPNAKVNNGQPSCQEVLQEVLAQHKSHDQSPKNHQRADGDVEKALLRQGYANRCQMQAQSSQVEAQQSSWAAKDGQKALIDDGWQRLVASQQTINVCVRGLPSRDTAAKAWPEGVGLGKASPPVMAVLWRHVKGLEGSTENIPIKKLNKMISGRHRV